jgi:hypothetical protein
MTDLALPATHHDTEALARLIRKEQTDIEKVAVQHIIDVELERGLSW